MGETRSAVSKGETMKESLIADRDEVLSDGGEVEKKKTEFKPFNLTKPKPKMIPPPE